jgi:hypothetical protein
MDQATEDYTKPPNGLTFLEFVEQCCENCRIVRWLGKKPPKGREFIYREHDRDYKPRWSPSCPLCQQLIRTLPLGFAPEGLCGAHLDLQKLDRVTVADSQYQSSGRRPYDVLHVRFAWSGSEFGWDISFALIDRPGGRQYEVKAASIEPFVNWKAVRKWIGHCEATHSLCARLSDELPPGLRIIDCETGAVTPFRDNTTPYVALSYVWGDSQDAQEDYPQTVLDSMEAVLALGLRYLWVDRNVCRYATLRYITLMPQVYRPERWYSQIDADRANGSNLPQSISHDNFVLRRCQAGTTWDAQTPSRLATFALARRSHSETLLQACRMCPAIPLEK